MSYVHTVEKALTLPAMPDMKPAISAVMPRPEQARSEVAHHHQRQHFVEAVARRGATCVLSVRMTASMPAGSFSTQCQQPGQDHEERHEHLEGRADDRSQRAARRLFAESTRWTTRKSVVQ